MKSEKMNTVHVYMHIIINAVTASLDVNRKLKQKTLKQQYKNLPEMFSLFRDNSVLGSLPSRS